MEIYKNYLEDFMYIHQKLRSIYIKELDSLPKGRLIGYLSNGKYQYYHSESINGKYVRHGVGKNTYLKRQLARKEYLIKVIPILDNNVKVLATALSGYQSITPEFVIDMMSNIYKSLPTEYYTDKLSYNSSLTSSLLTGDNYQTQNIDTAITEKLQKWMDAPFDQSTYNPHEKIHTTSRNLKVRTKSELIIAEILYMYNIAFHYEERVYIRGRRYAPDFKIKLPDGRIYYWEHVGLTNDTFYMYDHYDKLRNYQYKGIVPWKNLILTYDNELGDLNTQIIHSEIKNKLLHH
ncbi:MAG: hypothetical protein IKJ85_01520 [Firmicutes bacterium]|nr:hypothetical protein [Bacillota bacterium]